MFNIFKYLSIGCFGIFIFWSSPNSLLNLFLPLLISSLILLYFNPLKNQAIKQICFMIIMGGLSFIEKGIYSYILSILFFLWIYKKYSLSWIETLLIVLFLGFYLKEYAREVMLYYGLYFLDPWLHSIYFFYDSLLLYVLSLFLFLFLLSSYYRKSYFLTWIYSLVASFLTLILLFLTPLSFFLEKEGFYLYLFISLWNILYFWNIYLERSLIILLFFTIVFQPHFILSFIMIFTYLMLLKKTHMFLKVVENH